MIGKMKNLGKAAMETPAGMFANMVTKRPGLVGRNIRKAGDASFKAASGIVSGYGDIWERGGWTSGLTVGITAGAVLGGASAMADIAFNRPVSQLSTVQQGSAYSGEGGFGSRRSTNALHESTQGLVQGMHRARH